MNKDTEFFKKNGKLFCFECVEDTQKNFSKAKTVVSKTKDHPRIFNFYITFAFKSNNKAFLIFCNTTEKHRIIFLTFLLI